MRPVRVWSSLVAAGAALAVGACVASWWSAELALESEPAGPAVWIAADRDGDELVALDAQLFVAERIAVPWPTHVRGTRAGLWVACAVHGHPKAAHELCWRPSGSSAWSALEVPAVLDLECDDAGRALALVRASQRETALLRATPQGVELRIAAPERARSLAPCGELLGLAAGASGLLALDSERAAWSCVWSRAGTEVLDAAPADDGWWVLLRGGFPGSETVQWIGLDGSAGAPLRAADARRVVATAGAASALWILDERDGWARRIDPASGAELAIARLAALGVSELAVASGGGLVLASAGAVLRLAGDGRPSTGQGGFQRLADLARLHPP